MDSLLPYLIRSSLILTGVYVIYQVLRNDCNFTRNRIFLVTGLILSLILPLLSFSSPQAFVKVAPVSLEPVIVNANSIVTQHLDFGRLLLVIYLAGVGILLARLAVQIVRLVWIARNSNVSRQKGYTLFLHNLYDAPFSFFRCIFLNEKTEKDDAEAILAHERAHVNQFHSLDVMLMEFVFILQWFNPVAWFYKKMLSGVHEYLADRSALDNGVGKAGYLQLLFAMALKVNPAEITNNFCQTKLKRRITMITKMKNARFSGLKFMCSVCVLGLLAWMVSCNNSDNNNEQSTAKDTVAESPANPSTGEVYTVVENMPEYPGGNEAMSMFLSKNIQYPEKAKESGIQGTVFISFVVKADGVVSDVKVQKGIGSGCDEEALRVVKMMPKWKPGQQSGKNVSVQFTLPVKFMLQ